MEKVKRVIVIILGWYMLCNQAQGEFVIRQNKGRMNSSYPTNAFPNSYSQHNFPGTRFVHLTLVNSVALGSDISMALVAAGLTYDSNFLNDIWGIVLSNNLFMYRCFVVGGFNLYSLFSSSLNVYSSQNRFGGRENLGGWFINLEEILIIGGYGYSNYSANSFNHGFLCDVFVVNITSSLQKYILYHPPNLDQVEYGTKFISSPSNNIAGRSSFVGIPFSSSQAILFGGYSLGNIRNDLFVCDFSSDSIAYIWYHGSNLVNQKGIYGNRSEYSSSSCPGARSNSASWIYKSNLLLFGGEGFGNSVSSSGYLNDLWSYNISSNQFAFLKGSNGTNQPIKLFGMKKDYFHFENVPGARQYVSVAQYSDSIVILFGGFGVSYSEITGSLSEVWIYNNDINEFLMKKGGFSMGDTFSGEGEQNKVSSSNCPFGRFSSSTWKLSTGNIAIFLGSEFRPELWECSVFDCFGLSGIRDSVCFSNGRCVGFDVCDCFSGYSGVNCSEWNCYNHSRNSSSVCEGKGVCVSSDVCKCTDLDYQGNNCVYTGAFSIAIIVSSVTISASILIVFVILCILGLFFYINRSRKKKQECTPLNPSIPLENQNLEK